MDTPQASAGATVQESLPESSVDVKVLSINGTKLHNGTNTSNEVVDIHDLIDDWMHFRNLPSLKRSLVGLTAFIHAVAAYFLEYSLYEVLLTLAIVESPQVVVPAPWTDKKRDDNDETPRQIQHERSITNSLRTLVRHVNHVGGALAFCRGFAINVCIYSMFGLLMLPFAFLYVGKDGIRDPENIIPTDTLGEKLKDQAVMAAFMVFANVLLGSWDTAWLHIVITQPTLRVWYRRLPPYFANLRATWRPVLLYQLASFMTANVTPIVLKHAFGLYKTTSTSDSMFSSINMLRTLVWAAVLAQDVLTRLPAKIMLNRIQASILPEEEEPIVPLDRSFGTAGTNGLQPGILAAPRGPLTLREAWRSITRSEFKRLLIFKLKLLAVHAVFNSIFWLALGNSVWPSSWVPTKV